uniref:Uncharacterized protein n=1 Tax=Anguilla anguilla TaxID=7936 RepID=A0A0E9Q575_ANGAN
MVGCLQSACVSCRSSEARLQSRREAVS